MKLQASYLPISIIIIGVGDDDFETMDILDGDTEPLTVGDNVADRDIVQVSGDPSLSYAMLLFHFIKMKMCLNCSPIEIRES